MIHFEMRVNAIFISAERGQLNIYFTSLLNLIDPLFIRLVRPLFMFEYLNSMLSLIDFNLYYIKHIYG